MLRIFSFAFMMDVWLIVLIIDTLYYKRASPKGGFLIA